jgi:uncharacterized protein (DUF1810 family)
MADDFDLERFVAAQDGVYDAALAELRAGRKTGHWIWFVFPQVAGLGRSEMSRIYAIGSLAAARRTSPTWSWARVSASASPRCSRRAATARTRCSARSTRSSPLVDDAVPAGGPDEPAFRAVLDRFYDGRPTPRPTRSWAAASRAPAEAAGPAALPPPPIARPEVRPEDPAHAAHEDHRRGDRDRRKSRAPPRSQQQAGDPRSQVRIGPASERRGRRRSDVGLLVWPSW